MPIGARHATGTSAGVLGVTVGMRIAFAVIVLALAGALLFVARAGEAPAPPRAALPPAPPAATPPADDPPLLRVAGRHRVQLTSPRTLQAQGRPIRLPAPVLDGITSPSGQRAAFLSTGDGSQLVILDVPGRYTGGSVRVGKGPVGNLAWLTEDTLVAFDGIGRGGTDLVEIDAARRTVVSRRHFRGEAIATARSGDGLVALLAPPGRIGPARLFHMRAHGPDRTIPLLSVRAGFDRIDPGETVMRAANVQPGLAVHPQRDVAYVVDAETDRLEEVDLRSGTHREGPLGRAAKVVDSRVRHAAWLGGGKLAVAGHRDRGDGRIEPHGVRIVDVRHPRRPQVMVARRQSMLAAGEERVVAWGIPGGGIAIHDRHGRRERRLLRGIRVTHVEVHGPYAHVHTQAAHGRNAGTRVVELRTGRIVGRGRARGVAVAASIPDPLVPRLTYSHGVRGRLALVHPLTLRRAGGAAVVNGRLWDWDRSPGGRTLALAVSNRGRVQLFGARPLVFGSTVETGRREPVRALRYVAADRLVAIAGPDGEAHALDLDLTAGRFTARHRLGGRALVIARMPDGLAVLLSPPNQAGPASLVLLRGGEPRRIELPGVRAGVHERRDIRPDDPPDLIPGLVVSDGAAYVAPTGAPRILRVDLASGAVTTHPLGAATAKGGAVQWRGLQDLGGGRLLLSVDDHAANGHRDRSGSSIVDTATFKRHALVTGPGQAIGTPAGIVVARYEEHVLTVHDARGRRIGRLRPSGGMSAVDIHGRYAYVANRRWPGREHRTYVIDLRTGKLVRTLSSSLPPGLLTHP